MRPRGSDSRTCQPGRTPAVCGSPPPTAKDAHAAPGPQRGARGLCLPLAWPPRPRVGQPRGLNLAPHAAPSEVKGRPHCSRTVSKEPDAGPVVTLLPLICKPVSLPAPHFCSWTQSALQPGPPQTGCKTWVRGRREEDPGRHGSQAGSPSHRSAGAPWGVSEPLLKATPRRWRAPGPSGRRGQRWRRFLLWTTLWFKHETHFRAAVDCMLALPTPPPKPHAAAPGDGASEGMAKVRRGGHEGGTRS